MRSRSSSLASAVRWAAVMPLVFVGAMMFWTMAFGLGGLSLVTLMGLSADDDCCDVPVEIEPSATGVEPKPGLDGTSEIAQSPITVQIQESAEPEDMQQQDRAETAAGSGYILTTD